MDQPRDQQIEFFYTGTEKLPPPVPAAHVMPDWLKQIPADVQLVSQPLVAPSVKRCMPFVDAMTAGYAIPLAADVEFTMEAGPVLSFRSSAQNLISTQDAAQVAGAPFANHIIVKFLNPWVIKTPPGYSTLFVPMLNQFTMPLTFLSGIVDTDTFYFPVSFLAVCTMQIGQKFAMPRGTPIVQAIPIKRDTWHVSVAPVDVEHLERVIQEGNTNSHIYGQQYWQKKSYR